MGKSSLIAVNYVSMWKKRKIEIYQKILAHHKIFFICAPTSSEIWVMGFGHTRLYGKINVFSTGFRLWLHEFVGTLLRLNCGDCQELKRVSICGSAAMGIPVSSFPACTVVSIHAITRHSLAQPLKGSFEHAVIRFWSTFINFIPKNEKYAWVRTIFFFKSPFGRST